MKTSSATMVRSARSCSRCMPEEESELTVDIIQSGHLECEPGAMRSASDVWLRMSKRREQLSLSINIQSQHHLREKLTVRQSPERLSRSSNANASRCSDNLSINALSTGFRSCSRPCPRPQHLYPRLPHHPRHPCLRPSCPHLLQLPPAHSLTSGTPLFPFRNSARRVRRDHPASQQVKFDLPRVPPTCLAIASQRSLIEGSVYP